MSTVHYCRTQADLCRKLARIASDHWVAAALQQMAEDFASRAERLEAAEGVEAMSTRSVDSNSAG